MASKLRSYRDTSVSVNQSRDAIEKLLQKVGAVGFRWSSIVGKEDTLEAGLRWSGKDVAFRLTVRYTEERNQRQQMRALYWYLKSKVEAIQFGLVDVQEEFFPYLITAAGGTVFEEMQKGQLPLPQLFLPEGGNDHAGSS